MSAECPLECVQAVHSACDPDFLEKNGAWLLTVIGGLGGCFGMMLTYFLNSRCRRIDMCGCSCVRDVLPAQAPIEIKSNPV